MENQFGGFFSYPASLPFQMEMSRNIAVLHVTEQGRLLLYSWHEVAALIWLTGVMGLLVFSLITYRHTLRRIRQAQVPASSELRDAILEAATCSGLRRTPLLLVSAKVQSPAVTGLFRPVLLLPARFPGEQLTPAETKLVLLHEMTHLKRFDLPVNWFLFFLQALHCFNPLLWFAFARMRIDRECACDAQVLATSKEDQRAEYGHALLKLESVPGPSEFSLGFIGIRERYQNVRSRIQAIAGYHRPHPAWSILTAGLIVTLLVAGATRAENPAPAGKPESPKKGTPSGPVEISGDTTAYSAKDHTAIASGHARYGQRGMTVTVQADTIRYNPDKHTLEAIGNVTVARAVDLEHLRFNLSHAPLHFRTFPRQ